MARMARRKVCSGGESLRHDEVMNRPSRDRISLRWDRVVGAPSEDSNATGIGGSQTDESASGAGAAYIIQ